MKYLVVISVLISLMISGCSEKRNTVIITGRIIDASPSGFEYTVPENGVSFFGFKKNIETDSTGNFSITIKAESLAIIDFMKGFRSYGSLIIEPGKQYEVLIGQKYSQSIRFLSSDSSGQILYNKFKNRNMLTGHFELEARNFRNYGNNDSILTEIARRQSEELQDFRNLLERKEISPGFLDIVNSDRKYYWAGVAGSVAFMNYMFMPRGINRLSETDYKLLWQNLFDDGKEHDAGLMRSVWFYYFLQNYLRWQELIVDSVSTDTLSGYHTRGMIHTHNLEYAGKHLKEPFLEYYRAAYICTEAVNKNYEEELVTLFNDMEKDYPGSLYTGYLSPLIDEIRMFHKKAGEVADNDYHFLPSETGADTFDECIRQFSGRKIYIDVWATWCGPCKTEFRLTGGLRSLLEKKKTEVLYISIDKSTDKKKWEDMIRFYDLKGHHILAGEKLQADLRRLYGQNGLIAIPWHLIIDENGKIVKLHASGPSLPDELEKELK